MKNIEPYVSFMFAALGESVCSLARIWSPHTQCLKLGCGKSLEKGHDQKICSIFQPLLSLSLSPFFSFPPGVTQIPLSTEEKKDIASNSDKKFDSSNNLVRSGGSCVDRETEHRPTYLIDAD